MFVNGSEVSLVSLPLNLPGATDRQRAGRGLKGVSRGGAWHPGYFDCKPFVHSLTHSLTGFNLGSGPLYQFAATHGAAETAGTDCLTALELEVQGLGPSGVGSF